MEELALIVRTERDTTNGERRLAGWLAGQVGRAYIVTDDNHDNNLKIETKKKGRTSNQKHQISISLRINSSYLRTERERKSESERGMVSRKAASETHKAQRSERDRERERERTFFFVHSL